MKKTNKIVLQIVSERVILIAMCIAAYLVLLGYCEKMINNVYHFMAAVMFVFVAIILLGLFVHNKFLSKWEEKKRIEYLEYKYLNTRVRTYGSLKKTKLYKNAKDVTLTINGKDEIDEMYYPEDLDDCIVIGIGLNNCGKNLSIDIDCENWNERL